MNEVFFYVIMKKDGQFSRGGSHDNWTDNLHNAKFYKNIGHIKNSLNAKYGLSFNSRLTQEDIDSINIPDDFFIIPVSYDPSFKLKLNAKEIYEKHLIERYKKTMNEQEQEKKRQLKDIMKKFLGMGEIIN